MLRTTPRNNSAVISQNEYLRNTNMRRLCSNRQAREGKRGLCGACTSTVLPQQGGHDGQKQICKRQHGGRVSQRRGTGLEVWWRSHERLPWGDLRSAGQSPGRDWRKSRHGGMWFRHVTDGDGSEARAEWPAKSHGQCVAQQASASAASFSLPATQETKVAFSCPYSTVSTLWFIFFGIEQQKEPAQLRPQQSWSLQIRYAMSRDLILDMNTDLWPLLLCSWGETKQAWRAYDLILTRTFFSPLVLIRFPHSQGMDKNITQLNVRLARAHRPKKPRQRRGPLRGLEPESPLDSPKASNCSPFPVRGNNMPNDYIAGPFNYNALKVCTLYFSKFFPLR